MAYTKIKPVRNHLARCLDYTATPQKTVAGADLQKLLNYTQNSEKTERQLFVTGFNCDPENACEIMDTTRQRFHKGGEGHVLAYHVIQSFAPGEVTPEQAHQIGCEFARRVLADRYEVTVSTHLDRKHLHNHIVFNSVSFADGKMYRNNFRDYYQGIRKKSDDICREQGLSIIDPQGKGKQYTEWQAEQQGKDTMRGMIRADVDKALETAISWETFVLSLKHMGYEVKCGPNVKHAALRHKTGSRYIRLRSLGANYTEQAIRQRLTLRQQAPCAAAPACSDMPPALRRQRAAGKKITYRLHGRWPPRHKIGGFMGLYYHYLRLLGKAKHKHTSRRCHYLLREDFRKFDRYQKQCHYLWEKQIESPQQLADTQHNLSTEVARLVAQREPLYKLRRAARSDSDKAPITAQMEPINQQLRQLRQELALCHAIEMDAAYLQQRLPAVQQAESEQQQQKIQKEMNHHEQRR